MRIWQGRTRVPGLMPRRLEVDHTMGTIGVGWGQYLPVTLCPWCGVREVEGASPCYSCSQDIQGESAGTDGGN